jgi:hypothetical protein
MTCRIDQHAGALADDRRERRLVRALDVTPLGAKSGILDQRLEAA